MPAVGCPIGETVSTYSILTIGDGLGAQIPSFIIAISMGMLITKTRSKVLLGDDVSAQLFFKTTPLIITAGVLIVLCFMPGLPKIPFILMSVPLLLLFRAARKPGKKNSSWERGRKKRTKSKA